MWKSRYQLVISSELLSESQYENFQWYRRIVANATDTQEKKQVGYADHMDQVVLVNALHAYGNVIDKPFHETFDAVFQGQPSNVTLADKHK